MYNSMVSTNKLQNRFHHIQQEALAPGTGTRHTALGVIEQVYDQEYLSSISVDTLLKEELDKYPGLLFGKIKLDNGDTYVLPFKDTEDFIYLTFGNSLQLQGRRAKVEFEGMTIGNGHIIVQRSYAERQVNLALVTKVLDIGGII